MDVLRKKNEMMKKNQLTYPPLEGHKEVKK